MTNDLCERLTAIVGSGAADLLKIPDDRASRPRGPGKWSPKQIVGHLIDSAVNNHARFVRAQLQDDLVFPRLRPGRVGARAALRRAFVAGNRARRGGRSTRRSRRSWARHRYPS